MSLESKKIKVLYNTLIKYKNKKSIKLEEKSSPLYEINDILLYIGKKIKRDKIKDLKGNKFCFIEDFHFKETDDDEKTIVYGFFKSARNHFRPNLINKHTGRERSNPKEITEGDIQKTHFIVVIDQAEKEVFFVYEYNYDGVTVNNMIDYFQFFSNEYCKEVLLIDKFVIKNTIIPKDNFIEVLSSMKRVKVADVFIDKQILGSDALNLSNRTVEVKNELRLSIGSKPRESIKSTAVDLFNKFTVGSSGISKIRIEGKDIYDNDLIIDTSFINKREYISVERNTDTGELVTSQIYAELFKLIELL